MQWVLTEQAATCYSRVVVPLYDTLGPDAVSYIINLGEHIHLTGLLQGYRLACNYHRYCVDSELPMVTINSAIYTSIIGVHG